MIDYKEQGNALFKEGEWLKAAASYTKAIKQEPGNHVLYSNRSAALLKLGKLSKAAADAEQCVTLDPSWPKGWMRKALVLESQGQLQQALECFQKAHEAAGGTNSDYAARIKALKQKTSSQQKAAKTVKSAAEHAALAYADSKLAYARERIIELGSNFPPELHFLYAGSKSSNSNSGNSSSKPADGEDEPAVPTHPGSKELQVRASSAFDAPDVLSMFVGEMRKQAQDLQATIVTLVAPKAAVSFPQTWKQSSWQYGSADGVFVQVQALVPQQRLPLPADDDTAARDSGASKAQEDAQQAADGAGGGAPTLLNKTFFIRLRPDKPPSEPIEVSGEFGLLPPLLQ